MTIRPEYATAGPAAVNGYVPGAARRIPFKVTASDLQGQLVRAGDRDQASPLSALAVDEGGTLRASADRKPLREGERLLPLRLGAFRTALDSILDGDSWLADREPVLYTGGDQRVHLDFPNLAGFVVAPDGRVLSRAVNPA